MANKDFFDEEFDKLERESENKQSDRFQDWSAHQTPQPVKTNNNKPLYIVLICLALVLCLILGWVLCTIFSNLGRSSQSQSALFDEVLRYLDTQYYKEVPDEKMWSAMEQAGTAMLQNAGDQFSRLMSPATYYDFCNPQSSYSSNENGTFGVEYQFVEGIGMYIYDAVIDSTAYGKLQEADIVVKISDIETIHGTPMGDIITNAISKTEFLDSLNNIKSAKFHVLRNGEMLDEPVRMTRGVVDYANAEYKFEFIEFYFGDNLTNISTKNMGTAATNTKEARKLSQLSKLDDTGYIRIKEFSHILVPDENNPQKEKIHSVVDEFKIAMNLFSREIKNQNDTVIKKPLKHLILDLKGNPGGNVQYVSEIAGMLATDVKLTDSERKKVNMGNEGSLITSLEQRNGAQNRYPAKLSYTEYFGTPSEKPDIVVWTDGGSASASELLTGALLDYKTAVQMGTRTYGKGIAQTWMELNFTGSFKLSDGTYESGPWAIYYTVAEYFSPVTHTNIHGTGYVPIDTPEARYNNLDTYEKLWEAAIKYFSSSTSGTGNGGILAIN